MSIEFIPKIYKKNFKICCTAIEQTGHAFKSIDETLKRNHKILIKTISHGKYFLKITPNYMNKDEFRLYIQKQLLSHQGLLIFLNEFLSLRKNKSKISKLSSHGFYFANNIKKMITNYSGIFIGKEWLELVNVAIFIKLFYDIWIITKCADTGFVPPPNGVIVKAVVSDAGFLILIIVFIVVVLIIHTPINCVIPVDRPTIV